MAFSTGMRHGSYEILSAIGAGGMGEVYRARDTSLKRDVALKILPESFATDSERLARFQREAEVLASLNHPNIAAIYGFEHANGVKALVMELVEGEDLAERIARGPIPLDEVLPIARQIAEALEAAHEQGIIHRDLKPANVKVRPDGTVKVLDFGLAKTIAGEAHTDLANSPTVTAMATRAGVLLGTAAYMSPEQTRGKTVDKRTDIWAFGCVLYEMLTARRPFSGETVTDAVAAIINSEPDWQALPPRTPERIRSLIVRCLRKDPAQRVRDIADGRFQIEEVLNDPGALTTVLTPARTYREWASWIAAALFLGTTLFFATRPSTTSSSRDSTSFPVFPPEQAEFSARTNTTLNIPSFCALT